MDKGKSADTSLYVLLSSTCVFYTTVTSSTKLFIHTLAFSNCFILVRVAGHTETIPGILYARLGYTQGTTNTHHPFTQGQGLNPGPLRKQL